MIALFISVQFIFSVAFIITKKSLLCVSPIFLVSMRMLISAIPMLAYYFFVQRRKTVKSKNKNCEISKKDVYLLIGVAIFNVFLPNTFEAIGMTELKASTANFIYSISPLITAIFGYFGFLGLKETFNFKKILGMSLSFVGFLLFIFFNTKGDGCAIGISEVYLLIATAGNIVGWILVKRLADKGMSIALINGASMLMSSFIAFPAAFIFEKNFVCCSWSVALFWMFLSALVTFVIAYNLKTYLLKAFSATFVAIGIFISPFITAILGLIFLKESITPIFIVALVLIAIGTYISFKQEKRQS